MGMASGGGREWRLDCEGILRLGRFYPPSNSLPCKEGGLVLNLGELVFLRGLQ